MASRSKAIGTHPYRGLRGPLAERLWARVDRRGPDECWPWTGPIDGDRGRIGKGGKRGGLLRSSQAAWIVTRGPIPDGMVVRHKCDNPPCCNPSHLELGTQADNVRDMIERGRLNMTGIRPGSLPKLTLEQAERVRAQVASGASGASVARSLGVSPSTIYRILRREVYP